MKQVTLFVDRPKWAFDVIAQQLLSFNDRSFALEIFYLRGADEKEFEKKCDESDLLFFFFWGAVYEKKKPWYRRFQKNTAFSEHHLVKKYPFIDLDKSLIGIHSHHDYDDRQSMPDKLVLPPPQLVEAVASFKNAHAVSQRLVRCYQEAGLQSITCTPNGVDIHAFAPAENKVAPAQRLKVGSSGTKKRDWKEGITEFIEPLGKLDFVDLRMAIPQEGKYVPHEEMPRFLRELDVYVLASSSEGFPLKAMEAAACGVPVISTKVGGCEDMIIDGENGFFVERTQEAFEEKLRYLHQNRDLIPEMSKKSRQIMQDHWSWEKRIVAWLDFIEANLSGL